MQCTKQAFHDQGNTARLVVNHEKSIILFVVGAILEHEAIAGLSAAVKPTGMRARTKSTSDPVGGKEQALDNLIRSVRTALVEHTPAANDELRQASGQAQFTLDAQAQTKANRTYCGEFACLRPVWIWPLHADLQPKKTPNVHAGVWATQKTSGRKISCVGQKDENKDCVCVLVFRLESRGCPLHLQTLELRSQDLENKMNKMVCVFSLQNCLPSTKTAVELLFGWRG